MKKISWIILTVILIAAIAGGFFYWRTNIKNACGVENCHGLEVQCGSNISQACTAMYASGDICRKYAECAKVNGLCKQAINNNFSICKSCVENCQKQYVDDPEKSLTCESNCDPANQSTNQSQNQTQKYAYPIKNFTQNQTKKVFGQYITPQNSPVQPERFSGYHTGLDIEVSSSDLNKDMPVYSILSGMVRYVNYVSGYGGVIVVEYNINDQTVTALYGHIRLSSAEVKVGDKVSKGEQIAVLGTAYSQETNGERKHLHFAIHKNTSIELRGYVGARSELSAWIDPNNIY